MLLIIQMLTTMTIFHHGEKSIIWYNLKQLSVWSIYIIGKVPKEYLHSLQCILSIFFQRKKLTKKVQLSKELAYKQHNLLNCEVCLVSSQINLLSCKNFHFTVVPKRYHNSVTHTLSSSPICLWIHHHPQEIWNLYLSGARAEIALICIPTSSLVSSFSCQAHHQMAYMELNTLKPQKKPPVTSEGSPPVSHNGAPQHSVFISCTGVFKLGNVIK